MRNLFQAAVTQNDELIYFLTMAQHLNHFLTELFRVLKSVIMDFEPAVTDFLCTCRLHKQSDIISPVQLIWETNMLLALKGWV